MIWTSLQFLVVCRKDQSRNVKQADAAAYSSCNLVRAVRSDSGGGDRFALSFPFSFGCAVGLLTDTSVLLRSECQTQSANHWARSICGCIPKKECSEFEAEMGEVVASFTVRESAAECRGSRWCF